jgi:hypothetical protein
MSLLEDAANKEATATRVSFGKVKSLIKGGEHKS